MPFDDDDDAVAATAPAPTAATEPAAGAGDDDAAPTAEEALEEEEAQDFRLFGSLQKRNISSQSIRKGEKDFESHGTRAQEAALEQSRLVMEEVLSYARAHRPAHWLRGWYFPDRWAAAAPGAEAEAEEAAGGGERKGPAAAAAAPRKWEVNARERVVVVEADRGQFKTMGRIVTGQPRDQPGWDRIWLLPEEALFLVERGSLDLWWPTRPLADIFPVPKRGEEEAGGGEPASQQEQQEQPQQEQQQEQQQQQPPRAGDGEDDEYSLGLPLSLEAAYSLLIGGEGERGKVTLRQFQVYANLSRAGYRIFRAPSAPAPAPAAASPVPPSAPLWQWLVSLLSPAEAAPRHAAYGPLVRPGLYRSYKPVYQQLALLPRHRPAPVPAQPAAAAPRDSPFRLHYHVWKAGTAAWSKTRPPPCDFYLAVADAHESSVPTLDEVAALLAAAPPDPPRAQWAGPGRLYPRLKHGHRAVLVAVVDHGVVNYLRFGEGAFGEERLHERFDAAAAGRGPRGGKRGGRGGRRGRGGRGRGR